MARAYRLDNPPPMVSVPATLMLTLARIYMTHLDHSKPNSDDLLAITNLEQRAYRKIATAKKTRVDRPVHRIEIPNPVSLP